MFKEIDGKLDDTRIVLFKKKIETIDEQANDMNYFKESRQTKWKIFT